MSGTCCTKVRWARLLVVVLLFLTETTVAKKCKYNRQKFKIGNVIEELREACALLVCNVTVGSTRKNKPVVMLIPQPNVCECQLSGKRSFRRTDRRRLWYERADSYPLGNNEGFSKNEGKQMKNLGQNFKSYYSGDQENNLKNIPNIIGGIPKTVIKIHAVDEAEFVSLEELNPLNTNDDELKSRKHIEIAKGGSDEDTRKRKKSKKMVRKMKQRQFKERKIGKRVGLSRKKLKKGSKACKYNKKKILVGQTAETLKERCVSVICFKNAATGLAELKMSVTQDCTCSTEDGEGGTCEYSHLHPDHSMCLGENKDCEIYLEGVTDKEKRSILQEHNQLRQKVANGEEGGGRPGPQPQAANMRELKWNDELARVAQAWANTCSYRHDCKECRLILSKDYAVGQNLYWQFTSSSDPINGLDKWKEGINAWYNEVEYIDPSMVESFDPNRVNEDIGHYTQMVWADTYEVGCGATYYKNCIPPGSAISFENCFMHACNYGPAGNYLGKPLYIQGKPASNCTSGISQKYEGLCK